MIDRGGMKGDDRESPDAAQRKEAETKISCSVGADGIRTVAAVDRRTTTCPSYVLTGQWEKYSAVACARQGNVMVYLPCCASLQQASPLRGKFRRPSRTKFLSLVQTFTDESKGFDGPLPKSRGHQWLGATWSR